MSSLGRDQDVLEYILTQLSAEKPDGSTRWWIQAEVLASVADFWANFRTDPNPGLSGLCGKILDQAKRNYLSAIRSRMQTSFGSTTMAGGDSPSPRWQS